MFFVKSFWYDSVWVVFSQVIFGDEWKFSLNEEDTFVNKKILEIYLDDDFNIQKNWVDVRPIPDEDTWFENVWNKFMKDDVVK